MRSTSQPLWIRSRRDEVAEAYKGMVAPLDEHAAELEMSGKVNKDGHPCDDHGTASDYRMTARYCEKMAQGISPQSAEVKAAAAVRKGWSKERPTDPSEVVIQQRQQPKPPPMPEPEDAMKLFRVAEFMERFTQREAEALILTVSLQMRDYEAAKIMGCSLRTITNLLYTARSKFDLDPFKTTG